MRKLPGIQRRGKEMESMEEIRNQEGQNNRICSRSGQREQNEEEAVWKIISH